jgi:hypothetical protein
VQSVRLGAALFSISIGALPAAVLGIGYICLLQLLQHRVFVLSHFLWFAELRRSGHPRLPEQMVQQEETPRGTHAS